MVIRIFSFIKKGCGGEFGDGMSDVTHEASRRPHPGCPRSKLKEVREPLSHYPVAIIVEQCGVTRMRKEEESLFVELEPVPPIMPQWFAKNHHLRLSLPFLNITETVGRSLSAEIEKLFESHMNQRLVLR